MAYLLGLNGKRQGRDLQLDRDLLHFGRSEANDFILEDPSVSGRHCTITRYDDGYTIRDLDSSNGTRVNDHDVTESKVEAGDVIEIGSLLFRFLEKDIGSAGQAPQIADAGDPFSGESVDAPPERPPVERPPSSTQAPASKPASDAASTSEAPTPASKPSEGAHAPSSVALPSGRMPLDLTHRSMSYTYIAVGGLIVLVIAVVVYLNLILS